MLFLRKAQNNAIVPCAYLPYFRANIRDSGIRLYTVFA
jgi:hypothetical protein